MGQTFAKLTAAEAAGLIKNGEVVGFSGFTPAGAAKAVPKAIAEHALREHTAGRPFQIGVMTGASAGPSLDGSLAKANAVLFRTPYQSNPDMRNSINAGKIHFYDMHLSMIPQSVRYGFLGPIHWAVIEACDANDRGEITLTSSVGASPTYCAKADKILVEINRYHIKDLYGMHDVYEPANPPHRREIPLYKPSDRIGSPVVKVDPKKIVGIVENDQPDETGSFREPDAITQQIGEYAADFLTSELKAGRIPKDFLPIQAGVGDTTNAVLAAMGHHPGIPNFDMYTEVIQEAVVGLMNSGKIRFASGCSLTVTQSVLADIYQNIGFFKPKLVLRPQEISNHPEVIRRLGIISINTALEADLGGHVNSTHVLGRTLMNGIGGSGDFARNAFLSIFICPSTAKNGKVSTIVPLVTHVDHSEHCVQVLVTEYGVADLRGKSPRQRAALIINNCVHPDYRTILKGYCEKNKDSHTPHDITAAFGMHKHFMKTGDMRGMNWEQ